MDGKKKISKQPSGQRKQVLTVNLDQERDRNIYHKLPKNFINSLKKINCSLASEPNCMFFVIYCLFMFRLAVR